MYLHAMRLGLRRNRTIGRKQSELPVASSIFIKRLDQATPGFALAVIDLAQIQHLPLHHLSGSATLVLDNIPITMLFAVFEASVETQEHDANQPAPNQIDEKDT